MNAACRRIRSGWLRPLIGVICSAAAGVAVAQSHWPDHAFHDSFEAIADAPQTDEDAARFLAQASYGPTAADIVHLRTVGYAGWLNEQFAATPSTQTQYLDWWADSFPDDYLSDDVRLEIWSINSAGTPDPSRGGYPDNAPLDQLRQRIAFALSEIFVVSYDNGSLANEPWALASFYDLLARDAFVNYRTLLEDVTKHPAMGVYLSMIGNRKAVPEENIHPDENYAREINQLFSVGLVKLNLDGTPVIVNGQPVATYGQEAVRGFAAVFTGWNWSSFGCSNDGSSYQCCNEDTYFWCGPGDQDDPPWQRAMEPVEAFHDGESDKQLLDYTGVALPGGVLHGVPDAQSELTAALDNIFHHPNVGPFVATRLIQRLVTSNPPPAYVQRVARIFNDDGSAQHVRGNLRAVVRAILLDPEARVGQWQHYATYGKLREPMLKVTHMWRALSGRSSGGRIGNLSTWPPVEDLYGQAPMRAPTVFNFFKPDYSQPGEIQDGGLVSPEFQILTDTTIVGAPNSLYEQIFCFYVGSDDCWNSEFDDTLSLDLQSDAAIAATSPGELLDAYDLLFMSGQMSPFMRSTILARLAAMDAEDYGADLGRARVQHALYLILNSPEYSVQK